MLDQPYVVPATPLTDTDGASYSLADDTDKRLTLVFFGYTHCPDVCTVVLSTLASAMTRLDDADREQVDVVFVTTDPQRDTEKVLRNYLDRFDPAFIGLTGPLDSIIAVGKDLAVAVEQGAPAPQRRVRHHPRHVGAGHRRRRRGTDPLDPGHQRHPVRLRRAPAAGGLRDALLRDARR